MCIRNDNLAKQNVLRVSRGKALLASVSRKGRETQLSPSVLTLRIPVMCRAHASFRGMLSRELPAKNSFVFNCLSLHTLSFSITQPLQLNPTINTRCKRLNKITIKFGTELKPTKHMVVSYNFTENIDKLNK